MSAHVNRRVDRAFSDVPSSGEGPVVRVESQVVERLEMIVDELRRIGDYCHAVTITRAGVQGLDATAVRDLAEIAEMQSRATRTAVSKLRSTVYRIRCAEVRAWEIAENDRRGIPNCDHLIRDPECSECNKPIPDKELLGG